jgi:Ni,Fe-hydrogenase maturation factor
MLPDDLVVYGIEIGRVEPGVTLSPEVDTAADEVVEMVATEIAKIQSP